MDLEFDICFSLFQGTEGDPKKILIDVFSDTNAERPKSKQIVGLRKTLITMSVILSLKVKSWIPIF